MTANGVFFGSFRFNAMNSLHIYALAEAKLQTKLRNPEPIVGSVFIFAIQDMAGKAIADKYVALPYLKGPGGEFGTRENLSEMHNPVAFVLTNKLKNPEDVLAWVDKMYDPEWSVQTNWGPLGYQYKKNDNGVMVFDSLKDGLDSYNDMRARNTIQGNSPAAILTDYYDTVGLNSMVRGQFRNSPSVCGL